MSKTFVAAALLAMTATASAESYDATQPVKPRNGYVGLNAVVALEHAVQRGVSLDAGARISASPVFVRGQVTGGAAGFEGHYTQVRAGIEARGCALRELVCGFAGADAGYQREHALQRALFSTDIYETNADDAMLVPRVGAELGHKLRFRSAIEMPMLSRLDDRKDSEPSRTLHGVGLSVGFAGTF